MNLNLLVISAFACQLVKGNLRLSFTLVSQHLIRSSNYFAINHIEGIVDRFQ